MTLSHFVNEVKALVTDKLQTLRQTKVKMILKCVMQNTNIAPGEVTAVEAEFHSKVEINLDGSDVNETYDITADKTRDNMAAFQRLEMEIRIHSLFGTSYREKINH